MSVINKEIKYVRSADSFRFNGDLLEAILFVGMNYPFGLNVLGDQSLAKGKGFRYERIGGLKIFKQTAKIPSRRLIRTKIKHFERMIK